MVGDGITGAAVVSVVEDLLGVPCADVRELAGGFSLSQTFALIAGGRDVVVKVNRDVTALAASRHNIAVLAELDVPVPSVLAYAERDSAAWLVMERIPGRDLGHEIAGMTRAEMTAAAELIVDIERRVATLPPSDGCGFEGIGERATRTWIDVVQRPNGYAWAEPLPTDVAQLVPELFDTIELARPYLDAVTGTCFLDDLTTKNVLIHNGRVAGIVDFDVVCYGDPLFQIGLTAAAVTGGHPGCRFYVDEMIRFTAPSETGRAAIDLYEAWFLVNFLGAENPHKPGEWRHRAATGATERVAAARRHFS